MAFPFPPFPVYTTRDPIQRNPFTEKLSDVILRNQDAATLKGMTDMAAQRLAGLGPQGAYWADAIRRDPRAALALSEQYGGFGEIESRLMSARAAGATSEAIGRLQREGASPREIVDYFIGQGDLDSAEKARKALEVADPGRPIAVRGEDGRDVYVSPQDAIGMQPIPKQPLVANYIGPSGLNPNEAIGAEDRAAASVIEQTKPLEASLDAYRAFRALADKIASAGRAPTPAETDSLAKLAARLENPEAVQEGDIARKAGGSVRNFFAGWAGIPYALSLEQLDGLVATADTIAAEKQRRLAEIQSAAQGVASGRGLNPTAVAPRAGQATRSADIPAGTRRTMTDPDTGEETLYEKVPGGWEPVE